MKKTKQEPLLPEQVDSIFELSGISVGYFVVELIGVKDAHTRNTLLTTLKGLLYHRWSRLNAAEDRQAAKDSIQNIRKALNVLGLTDDDIATHLAPYESLYGKLPPLD